MKQDSKKKNNGLKLIFKKIWNEYMALFLILPALLVTIGVLYPFIRGVYLALSNYSVFRTSTNFVGLDNLISILKSDKFWHATSVTMRYSILSVGSQLFLGIVIAMLLNRDTFIAKASRVLIILPLMIAPTIGSLMWKLMFDPSYGVLNYILAILHLPETGWAASPHMAMYSTVLVDTWIFTPFIALIVFAGLNSLPEEPYEAASIDRASKMTVFRRITIPLLMPYILIAVMFRLIDTLRHFDIIYTLTRGGPGDTMMSHQLVAYFDSFTNLDFSTGAAYMFLNWILIFIISQFFVKYYFKLQDRFYN
jgi:multiple sugar transport system permease protein